MVQNNNGVNASISIEEYVKRFDQLWQNDNPEQYSEMYLLSVSKIRTMNKHVLARLARLYRDGKGVEKNLSEAARLMYLAIDGPVKWAEREYIDILISMDTEQSLAEAFNTAKIMADNGFSFGQNRVSRLYRLGKGTKKDVNKAVEYMALAVKDNPGWSKEYVKLLLSTNVPAYWIKAYEYASQFPEDDYMIASISKMLEIGKGTEKDVDKSIEYMAKAMDLNNKWLLPYVDLLLRTGDPNNQKIAFNLCSNRSSDNPAIIGRLARMYRDGTGVTVDLTKAKQLMEQAANLGNEWAKEELKQME